MTASRAPLQAWCNTLRPARWAVSRWQPQLTALLMLRSTVRRPVRVLLASCLPDA